MLRTWVWSLGWEHPLEKGKTTHSSKAWRIPWTMCKESNMTEWLSLLQFFNQILWSWIINEWASQVALVVKNLSASAGNVRLGFDPWVRKIPWGSAWQPTSVCLLENPVDRGAWWLQSIGSQTVRHDWSNLTCTIQWVNWRIQHRDSTTDLTKGKKKTKESMC